MSPTERSLKYLRKLGYTVAVVERWNPFAKIRQDMWGIIDLVAIGKGETIGVQATSKSNVSSRIKKIAEHVNTPRLREAGWKLWILGWEKGAKEPRLVDVS